MTVRMLKNIWWKLRHWKSDLEEYENFDGAFYHDPRICFIPKPAPQQEADAAEESKEV